MRQLSIKKKIYLLIAIIMLPMITLQIVKIVSQYDTSIDMQLRSNEDFSAALGVSFMNYIELLWDTELAIGQAIAADKDLTAEEIGRYMKTVEQKQPSVREYSWVDKDMVIRASSEKAAIGVSLADREYMARLLKGEEKVISDMIISKVHKEATFIVVRAIKKDNVIQGFVIANVNVKELGQVFPIGRTSKSSSFGILDSKGVFVYRHGNPDIADKMISVKDNQYVAPALRGEVVKIKRSKSVITGSPYMGVNTPINQIGWVSFANTSYREISSRVYGNIFRDAIVLAFTIGICIFAALKISNRILKPIEILQKSAQELSMGNLSVRTNIKGTDEIAAAGQAFDHMAASINEYDKLKTQFFSTISHELKTPLNIILASIQMINSMSGTGSSPNEGMYKYIHMMKQNCYRLLRLINNLIDITRIDAGFLKMNMGNHNIVNIVEDITVSVAQYAESKGLELVFDTDIEEKIMACDPDKIERIMLNLLSNALKFTEAGGSIFVNIFDHGDQIAIAVKDTGMGIPADKLEVVFERFRQVDSSLHRQHEGSGIGLSLVKALVEAHDGTIVLTSECGRGSEFVVKFPVRVLEEEPMQRDEYNKQNIDRVQKINIEFSDIYS